MDELKRKRGALIAAAVKITVIAALLMMCAGCGHSGGSGDEESETDRVEEARMALEAYAEDFAKKSGSFVEEAGVSKSTVSLSGGLPSGFVCYMVTEAADVKSEKAADDMRLIIVTAETEHETDFVATWYAYRNGEVVEIGRTDEMETRVNDISAAEIQVCIKRFDDRLIMMTHEVTEFLEVDDDTEYYCLVGKKTDEDALEAEMDGKFEYPGDGMVMRYALDMKNKTYTIETCSQSFGADGARG